MPSKISQVLSAVKQGNRSSSDRLIELVYDDLRDLAQVYLGRESDRGTLQPTAVVHEAFIKLVGEDEANWTSKSHFYAASAVTMRRILVDHARAKLARKRGGSRQKIALNEEITVSPQNDADVLVVDEALNKLKKFDERRAKIVEMRFFAGMTYAEIAEVLSVSQRTVQKQWAGALVWLRRELAEGEA